MKLTIVTCLCLTILMTKNHASQLSAYLENNKGTKAAKNQEIEQALTHFGKSLEKKGDEGIIMYNIGNAHSQNNNHEKAQESYAAALPKLSQTNKHKAYHNLGSSFFKNKQYKEAITNYINALKINPSDKKTQKNLELAISYLQQQKQQQQQDKEEEKKDDKQQQKEEQQQKNEEQQAKNFLNNLNDHEQDALDKYKKKSNIEVQTDYDW